MRKFNLLYLVWGLGMLGLYFFRDSFKIQNDQVYIGTAETEGSAVNFEYPVKIEDFFVAAGQKVNKGDLLAKVNRSELQNDINEKHAQIAELKLEQIRHNHSLAGEITILEAQRLARTDALKYRIEEIKTEEDFNRNLRKRILKKYAPDITPDSLKNIKTIRLNALNNELQQIDSPIHQQIGQLRAQQQSSREIIDIQIKNLQEEIAFLKAEEEELLIYAQIEGFVNVIRFRKGTIVPPFNTIMEIYPETPNFIKAYIHESADFSLKPGDTVRVASYTRTGYEIQGFITGISSHLVEFPTKLRKFPELKMWGRQIYIQIPEKNEFLIGEKILISPLN